MITFEHVQRHIAVFVAGIVGSFFLAVVVGKFWPPATRVVFCVSLLFWVIAMTNLAIREHRSRDTAVFSDPKEWSADELPHEFQFITRNTTLETLTSELGPHSPVADTGIIRYDLPSGGAIFIYFDPPSTFDSKVRGVQFYRDEDSVPIFPT
ncbi:MAG: hypothetical protein H0X40_04665 [Chthoniobacterales bacterium]|nr:hypothetical protein [Chthoniobacterales bacterium]